MRHPRGLFAFAVPFAALLTAGPACAANYYVATGGSDLAGGTLAQPFASIARAQQAP